MGIGLCQGCRPVTQVLVVHACTKTRHKPHQVQPLGEVQSSQLALRSSMNRCDCGLFSGEMLLRSTPLNFPSGRHREVWFETTLCIDAPVPIRFFESCVSQTVLYMAYVCVDVFMREIGWTQASEHQQSCSATQGLVGRLMVRRWWVCCGRLSHCPYLLSARPQSWIAVGFSVSEL